MRRLMVSVRRMVVVVVGCALLGGSLVGVAAPASAAVADGNCNWIDPVFDGAPYSLRVPSGTDGVHSYNCYLSLGAQDYPRGDDVGVTQLQQALAICNGADISIDGIYGPATKAAVIAVQRAHGLTQDGVWGAQTKNAMGWPEYVNDKFTSPVYCYRF